MQSWVFEIMARSSESFHPSRCTRVESFMNANEEVLCFCRTYDAVETEGHERKEALKGINGINIQCFIFGMRSQDQ
jgi:hypothetical protein